MSRLFSHTFRLIAIYLDTVKKILIMLALMSLSIFLLSCGGKNKDNNRNESLNNESSTQAAEHVKKISSEDEFNTAIDKSENKLSIFDLYADWCRPCRILAPTLEKIAEESNGAFFFYRINVNQFPQIAQYFGVNGIPHVAFMKNKKIIATLVGLQPEEEYRKVINENTGN
jgi:thioredoxin 1